MTPPEREPRPGRLRLAARTRPAKLILALLVADVAVSAAALIFAGGITAPVGALDVVGVAMLLLGVMAVLVLPAPRGDNPPGDDDGYGGGGGSDDEGEPLVPSGGLEIDWQRFEEEFRAYAEGLTPAVGWSSES